jgi:hypothetical protein
MIARFALIYEVNLGSIEDGIFVSCIMDNVEIRVLQTGP